MNKKLTVLFFLISLLKFATAQISFSTITTPSNCSADGSISVNVIGGESPYLYQIISSTSGIIRPAQNVALFQNLPAGTYIIRVTDKNNSTVTNSAILNGNYVPLSFIATQQQSSIFINPINGKPPYKYSISTDNGFSFSAPKDSNLFQCLNAGSYLFRIYDSCTNFYTESVVVAPVIINANYSCIQSTPNIKSIVLNSIINGNGGFSFHAFGVNYNETNTTGNFTNINKCNKNISITVTDKCNVLATNLVCPTQEYTFEITCVNFKDHKVTIGNIHNGTGLSYQYIANDVISANSTVQNFSITQDSILAGLVDSCGFKNTIKIKPMRIMKDNTGSCSNNSIEIFTNYLIDEKPKTFPPTTYSSISGPTNFTITDFAISDTSHVVISNLKTGKYIYKITNACGDEVLDSFNQVTKCFKKLSVRKIQGCTTLKIYLVKDCDVDTNTVYTLTNMQGNTIAQNTNGIFNGLNNDSCYKVKMHELDCDTILEEIINPVIPKLKLFQNSCSETSFSVKGVQKKYCGGSTSVLFEGINDFVLADSTFTILETNNTGVVNPVPPNTYWIFARAPSCNSDTLKYTKISGFADSIATCITPIVKIVNNKCILSWNVKILNNSTNISFRLEGNGISVQGTKNFTGIDPGLYYFRYGCNEQALFLPVYYNFKSIVNKGCPSNASISATYSIDNNYIESLSEKYLYTVCDAPPIDYNIKEIGSNAPLTYSTTGTFNNLKTGTYYAIYYKGNEDCNFFSDTLFTPFYTRPALKATYGLICNGNNATVKASVIGGTPPYTYEVLNSSIPNITTDSTFVLYNNLPLGTSQFRVSDVCGISTDYATEVLSVNFEPTYKKKCDGQVQLIAPDIFNSTYVWTNKNKDTIGFTPIVYTIPNGNDSFTVTINHLSCSISKTLYINNFSASLVDANAGYDFSTDTTTTTLHANTPTTNTIGTWKQIDPSSGNTIFSNLHQENTAITVDVFPGQYTYIWTLTDTSIGCISEDTIVVSFLRCPNIKPILYTKTIKNATCANNGQIDIVITQAATAVHLLWNTGDTTASLKNINDSMYVVTISDETSCTPDIIDTILISSTHPTYKNIYDSICSGDTILIHQKKYFSAGNYLDTLINTYGCDSILNISIFTFSRNDSYDTINLCSNETYTLPNGLIITQSGNYIVSLQNSQHCDSLLHFTISFYPTKKTQIDTSICIGNNYQLPNGMLVNQTGTYIDSFRSTAGCDSIIQTNLLVKEMLSNLFLGNDTTICLEDILKMQLHYPNDVHYLWQDNSTQNYFDVKDEGIYFVKINDACSALSDTIRINTKDCSCNFYIPTAFSPNNDGVNDLFKPFIDCEYYNEYKLLIYNRWSELVFETDDANSGWNGIYKNLDQPLDNYIWIMTYYDILKEKKETKKGIILLLR